MINDGASSYKLNQDEVSYIEILELALKFKASDDNALRAQLGENVCDYLNTANVFNPLSDSYSKIQNIDTDPNTIILYAGNAFESFPYVFWILQSLMHHFFGQFHFFQLTK